MNTEGSDLSANRLLAMLPLVDIERLGPALTTVSLETGLVLNEPGDEPERIYFPHTGMISLLAVMADGKAVETATVGREGVVGAMAGLGVHITLTRAVVQVPVVASRIAAAPFRRAVQASDALRDMIVSYNDVLLGQVQITAACNALHPIQKTVGTVDPANEGSNRYRYRPADTGIAVGDAWRAPQLGQRDREETANLRPYSLQPRIDRDRETSSARSGGVRMLLSRQR